MFLLLRTANPGHTNRSADATRGTSRAVRLPAFGRVRGIRTGPKLYVGRPRGRFEREADAVAHRALRQPMAGDLARVHPATEGAGDAVRVPTLPGVMPVLSAAGRPLEPGIRRFMEERLGHDFGAVRIHADRRAAAAAEGIGARAFAVGRDVAFGRGEYRPDTSRGRDLLAHELVHTVQQGQVNQQAPVLQATWRSLGSFSWDNFIVHDQRVVLPVWVGNKSDWTAKLRNVDDANEVWSIKGFTETASDPSLATRSTPKNPARALHYQNNVVRAPNQSEILDFLRALYTVGPNLDLPNTIFEATGITRTALRSDISQIISKYQGVLLHDISVRGQTVSSGGIAAIGDQGGSRPLMAMIENAGATAMKAVDLIATARAMPNGRARSNELSNALATVRNAGRTIRYALAANAAAVAFNQSVADTVFDTVWGMIPGGGTIADAGMNLLKAGFKKMLDESMKYDEPDKQAQAILDEFVRYVRQARREGKLGGGNQGVNTESDAITGFEAAMR